MSGETPERGQRPEQDHTEFAGWFAAQGYPSPEDRYDGEEMEFAFTAGMQAANDLIADACTPTAADFDNAAEITRLRGVMERLAGEIEAEIAYLRETGVTRGNRDRQELATRIREALGGQA